MRSVDHTHFGAGFCAYSSLNSSTPPTQVARPPPSVWNPATRPSELPAQRPSPPLLAASTNASAPESESESAAKLCGGALRMGTMCGLLPNAKGTPENHTGGKSSDTTGLETLTGTTVAGVSRSGKCETRGVPGGGSMSENSAAKDVSGVALVPTAMSRFVFFERSVTKD